MRQQSVAAGPVPAGPRVSAAGTAWAWGEILGSQRFWASRDSLPPGGRRFCPAGPGAAQAAALGPMRVQYLAPGDHRCRADATVLPCASCACPTATIPSPPQSGLPLHHVRSRIALRAALETSPTTAGVYRSILESQPHPVLRLAGVRRSRTTCERMRGGDRAPSRRWCARRASATGPSAWRRRSRATTTGRAASSSATISISGHDGAAAHRDQHQRRRRPAQRRARRAPSAPAATKSRRRVAEAPGAARRRGGLPRHVPRRVGACSAAPRRCAASPSSTTIRRRSISTRSSCSSSSSSAPPASTPSIVDPRALRLVGGALCRRRRADRSRLQPPHRLLARRRRLRRAARRLRGGRGGGDAEPACTTRSTPTSGT